MSNAAGAGPFVLIFRPEQSIKGPNAGHPLCYPAMWRWDEALPEGWEVVPILQPHTRDPRGVPAPKPPLSPGPDYFCADCGAERPRQPHRDSCVRGEPEEFSDTVVDEPEWQDDEERLAAQARCKDMAFNLLEMARHGHEGKDIVKAARELYDALPGGE